MCCLSAQLLASPFPDAVYGANVFLHPSSVYRSPHTELHEEINIFIELLTDPPLPRAVSKCCSSVKQLGNNRRALKGNWGFNKLCQVCIQTGCKFYVCAACSIGNMMHFHQMKMIIVHVVVYYILTHLFSWFVVFCLLVAYVMYSCLLFFFFFGKTKTEKAAVKIKICDFT